MGDANPIRTLGDYYRPSHEGYMNNIELPKGNNVVPLRSDTIRLVQNRCSFHGLRSEDPYQHLKEFLKLMDSLYQHLKEFLKLMDSLDLDVAHRERMRLCLFQFSLCDQASNWLNIFQQDPSPHGRILLLVSLLNSFHREGLQNSVTASCCSNNLKESLFLKHKIVLRTYSKKSLIMASTFSSKSKSFITMSIPPHDKPLTNRTVLVKAIYLPQDVPSTSDRRLIKLENQVQRLIEAHLAPKQPIQVNKITSSCEICSGPHDTQYCMENPEQAFINYASSRTDKELEKALIDFDSHQERILSSLGAQLGQQQDDMISKINLLRKAVSEKLNDMPTGNTAGNPMTQMNFVSTNYPTKEELQGKGIKSPSKLLSSKYLSQSSLAEQNKNLSSPKRVNFINSIIILNKDDEAKESAKYRATEYKDHEITVESEEEFKEETEEETEEEEEEDNP
ncbi:hypothetical protein Tco_0982092 [Tanacetum coccineum]